MIAQAIIRRTMDVRRAEAGAFRATNGAASAAVVGIAEVKPRWASDDDRGRAMARAMKALHGTSTSVAPAAPKTVLADTVAEVVAGIAKAKGGRKKRMRRTTGRIPSGKGGPSVMTETDRPRGFCLPTAAAAALKRESAERVLGMLDGEDPWQDPQGMVDALSVTRFVYRTARRRTALDWVTALGSLDYPRRGNLLAVMDALTSAATALGTGDRPRLGKAVDDLIALHVRNALRPLARGWAHGRPTPPKGAAGWVAAFSCGDGGPDEMAARMLAFSPLPLVEGMAPIVEGCKDGGTLVEGWFVKDLAAARTAIEAAVSDLINDAATDEPMSDRIGFFSDGRDFKRVTGRFLALALERGDVIRRC